MSTHSSKETCFNPGTTHTVPGSRPTLTTVTSKGARTGDVGGDGLTYHLNLPEVLVEMYFEDVYRDRVSIVEHSCPITV